MKAKKKRPFNVEVFLATVDGGMDDIRIYEESTVFAQRDAADSVFLSSGRQGQGHRPSDQGKEAVVAIHGKGDFFGEGCLTGQPRRLATAAAIADSVVMRLDKASIVRVLQEEPTFSELFVSYLLARNARVEEDLVDQLFNSSEKRLARLLLLMANFGKEGRPEPVIASIASRPLKWLACKHTLLTLLGMVRCGRQMDGDREPEATWLRLRVIRLRAALRYALEPRVEVILRETIADMEDRLDKLEVGLAASRPTHKRSPSPQSK